MADRSRDPWKKPFMTNGGRRPATKSQVRAERERKQAHRASERAKIARKAARPMADARPLGQWRPDELTGFEQLRRLPPLNAASAPQREFGRQTRADVLGGVEKYLAHATELTPDEAKGVIAEARNVYNADFWTNHRNSESCDVATALRARRPKLFD